MLDVATSEKQKYEAIWNVDNYAKATSPGVENVKNFMKVLDSHPKSSSLIDLGCGSGKAGLEFIRLGFDVTLIDITDTGLDAEVANRGRFIEMPLWDHRWPKFKATGWDYGYCCDVMEHIPTEYVMLTLERIVSACRITFFSIALRPDVFGATIGQPLHLTVRDFIWWRDHLKDVGVVLEARDICGDGIFVVG